jgi:hypothetical protein
MMLGLKMGDEFEEAIEQETGLVKPWLEKKRVR